MQSYPKKKKSKQKEEEEEDKLSLEKYSGGLQCTVVDY